MTGVTRERPQSIVGPLRKADPYFRSGSEGFFYSVDDSILLNFRARSQEIPTYSIEDIHRCISERNTDVLREKFRGKFVLLRTWLDLEDRLSTSNRCATKPEKLSFGERCTEGRPEYAAVSGLTWTNIPGVLVQATAVSNILLHEYLLEPTGKTMFRICFALAFYIGLVGGFIPPIVAAAASLASMVGFVALGIHGISGFIVLPFLQAIIASLITFTGILAYRLIVRDQFQRVLRSNFKYYLSPLVVEGVPGSWQPPPSP